VSDLRPEVEPPRLRMGTLERLVIALVIVVLAAAATFAVVQRARRAALRYGHYAASQKIGGDLFPELRSRR
jgi:uncharacterized membrane protein